MLNRIIGTFQPLREKELIKSARLWKRALLLQNTESGVSAIPDRHGRSHRHRHRRGHIRRRRRARSRRHRHRHRPEAVLRVDGLRSR
jgi:hypothetical protein